MKLIRISNDNISEVGMNIVEKVTGIWNVADMLRELFKPHEYNFTDDCS